jgi:hypothetical protein
VGVNESHASVDRIYSQSQPRQVEKTHCGEHSNLESFVGEQSTNAVFQDSRRARYGVQRRAIFQRGIGYSSSDCRVYLGKGVVTLVFIVE